MRELDVLRDAISEALDGPLSPSDVRVKDTSVGTYDAVTDVDLRTERIVIERIRREFPGDAIVSEESSPDVRPSGRAWAVDPIDGTVNLARGIPVFGSQGVFMEDGVPRASVVCLPSAREMYTATDDGAFLNGTPIRTADPRPLRECVLTTGDFSRRSEEYRLMQARLMSECRGLVARFRMLGAACTDFAWLASGRTDIHVRFVNRIWDFLPGLYLAEMAGAVYDRDLMEETGILILCSSNEVLDAALSEILPRITSCSRR